MPSRFGGTKSRNGCTRCKERRVKCSETPPCDHCVRRREHCSLVDTESTRLSSPSTRDPSLQTVGQIPTPHSSANSPPLCRRVSQSWAFDLHLMNHFTTRTVHTLSSYHSLIDAWQTTIITDAAQQPFLMHGMLALAALHLASLSHFGKDHGHKEFPVHRYIDAFRYHQNEAMPEYRRILQNLELVGNEEFSTRSREPWPAGPIYAMSFLLGFLASSGVSDNSILLELEEENGGSQAGEMHGTTSLLNSRSAGRLSDIFDRLVSTFVATRGARVIVKAALEEGKLRDTAYWHLISPSTLSDHLPPLHNFSGAAAWYETLRTECLFDTLGEASPGRSDHDICAAALTCLQEVHEGAARSLEFKKERLWSSQRDKAPRYEMSWCLKWMAIVSQEYLVLVHERHQAALVILAQFAAICGLVEDEWYMKRWTQNAIAAIKHEMESAKALEWVDRILHRWNSAQI